MICRKWQTSLTILRILLSLLILGQGIPVFGSQQADSPIAVRVRAEYGRPSVVADLNAQPGTRNLPPQSGRVILEWSAPHSGDGSSVFSYVVRYATFPVTQEDLQQSTTAWWDHPGLTTLIDEQRKPAWGIFEKQAPGSRESIVISGLNPGQRYYFGVRALDRYHQLADSDLNLASIVHQSSACASSDPLKANLITSLMAFIPDPIETQTVRLEWTVPEFLRFNEDANDFVDPAPATIQEGAQYCVQYSTVAPPAGIAEINNTWAAHSLFISTASITTGQQQSLIVKGLAIDSDYYFLVFTKTQWGWSYPNMSAASAHPYQHIGSVRNLTATCDGSSDASTGSSITLSWENPTEQFLSGVRICYSTGTYPAGIAQQPYVTLSGQLSGAATSYTMKQLLPRTTYYFTAYAYDKDSTFAPGAQASTCTVTDILGPDPVNGFASGISMDEEGKLSIVLSWTTPDSAPLYRNGDYAGTQVSGSADADIAGGNGQPQSFTHHDLQVNSSYYYIIRGYDVVNNYSVATATTIFISDVFEKPGKPVIVSAYADTQEDQAIGCSATLEWRTPDTTNLSGIRIVYRTDRFPANVNDGTPVIDNRILTPNTTYTTAICQLLPETTYYFALAAVSKFAIASDLAVSSITTIVPWNDTIAPFIPLGMKLERASATSVKVSWKPVRYNNDQLAFTDRYNPKIKELYSYDIYRSTDLYSSEWTHMASNHGLTCSYTDTSINADTQYYYKIKARDASGNYRESFIVDMNDGVILLNTDRSYVWLPREALTDSNYFTILSHGEEEKGPVVRSIEWNAFNVVESSASLTLTGIRNFNAQRNVNASSGTEYVVRSGELVMSANNGAPAAISKAAVQEASSLSIYYFNGAEWMKLNSSADAVPGGVRTPIKFTGRYQLRRSAAANEFAFLGIMPRIITPNNDGQNDRVLFRYANPGSSPVKIRLFDIRGALVRELEQSTMTSDIQGAYACWDGTDAGGTVVDPGVYIYQIEGEGKLINGTIVVAR